MAAKIPAAGVDLDGAITINESGADKDFRVESNLCLPLVSPGSALDDMILNNTDIEKSVFLAEKKVIDSTCITISGNLVNKNKIFNWEIKQNI